MLSLERFAAVRAQIEVREARDEVLEGEGLSLADWLALERRWLSVLRTELAAGGTDHLSRYLDAFFAASSPAGTAPVDERGVGAPVAAMMTSVAVASESAADPSSRWINPPAFERLPEPPAVVVQPAWVPSSQAEPVVSFDPDVTLDPRSAKGPVLPFHPAPAGLTPPRSSVEPPPDSGLDADRPATAMTEEVDWRKLAESVLPFKADAAVQPHAPQPFDPDRTLDPRPSGGPAVPFQRGAFVVTPPAVPIAPAARSVPGVDETVMVKSPMVVQKPEQKAALGERLTPAAIPEVSLDAYAALQAKLRAFGDRAEVWRAAGIVTEDAKKAVQNKFYDLFRSDAASQAEFQASVRGHLARLNAGRGPRGV